MVYMLIGLLFVLIFGIVQGAVYLISGTTPAKEAKKQIEKIKNSQGFIRFIYDKQIQLKKMGAGVLLKDHMTVSQWYLYKTLMAGLFGLIAFFISAGVFKSDMAKPISFMAAFVGWFFLDLFIRLKNKASNDEMMPDIMEMSRSVLYGKRGGQYIADALKDSVKGGDDEVEASYPGADVVELVNLRGDTTTVYKLADGTYMDRIERRFTYNGTDTWTDEDGVEWNEVVK